RPAPDRPDQAGNQGRSRRDRRVMGQFHGLSAAQHAIGIQDRECGAAVPDRRGAVAARGGAPMTTTQIILVIAIVTAIATALLAAQRGGPRITTIETRRNDDK